MPGPPRRTTGSAHGGARDGAGPRRPGGRRYFPRRKVCNFCVEGVEIDYKDVARLRGYVNNWAKTEPRRKTGTCARHQRALSLAIKRARFLALLPYVSSHALIEVGRPERRGERARSDHRFRPEDHRFRPERAAPAAGLPAPSVAAATEGEEPAVVAAPKAAPVPSVEELPAPPVAAAPEGEEPAVVAAPEAAPVPSVEELPARSVAAAPEGEESTAEAPPAPEEAPSEEQAAPAATTEAAPTAPKSRARRTKKPQAEASPDSSQAEESPTAKSASLEEASPTKGELP